MSRSAKAMLVVFGALALLMALTLVVVGGGLAVAYSLARDDDGYYRTPVGRYGSDGVAVVAPVEDLTIRALQGEDERFAGWDLEATASLRATSTTSERDLFVGVASSSDVRSFLRGAAFDEVRKVEFEPFDVHYVRHQGDSAAKPPSSEAFWFAAATGPGSLDIRWNLPDGDWTAVVMNADGSAGVEADVVGRLKIDLLPLTLGFLAVGALAGIFGLGLLTLAFRSGRLASPDGSVVAPVHGYPARLEATLDEPLHRALWLVKWLLAVPHLVVLALLWMAFPVLTFIAGLSILFTGRYPRGIFDFNVGVLRWTWRVTYYAFVLGTDRYPPFSLASDPRYPCDFTVDYPNRLSRGLVLVKWWLLALPHFIVLALFGQGVTALGWDAGRWTDRQGYSIGIIGVLVLISAGALLVRGHYPLGLYDLILGLMRWTYRVYAYVALMRDEYPPFRLDTGGPDPGSLEPTPRPDTDPTKELMAA
jgi:hypothetical protein